MAMQPQQHFLVVAYPTLSHLNPSLQFAKSLTRFGVRVTFSTAVSAHRRMFPDRHASLPVEDPSDPLLSYHPYSDGYDEGYDRKNRNIMHFMPSFKTFGSTTLYALATSPGRPEVTCIVYNMLFTWVVDVASRLGVPSVLLWIQPAAVFAVFHHYFHSYREIIGSHTDDASLVLEVPGLPPLKSRDLPSFLVSGNDTDASTNEFVMLAFEEVFETLDNGGTDEKPRVLVNTFEELERDAIEAMREVVELVPLGPVLTNGKETCRFGKEWITDGEECINEWLDRWPERSVVYLSFGSISILGRKQKEEFACALVGCGRPFLWVAREERDGVEAAEGVERGKVVGWCNQVEVLAHRAVGCFVTHHGWNSTLEAICCGVPMVGLPQWSEQPTNARLVEGLWRVGVRAEVNGEGVVEGAELKRCLEAVMGGGEEAIGIRRRAGMWQEKAREAAKEGGPSGQNFKTFMKKIESGT